MDLIEVQKLARELMDEQGLTRWSLVMTNSKSFAGRCWNSTFTWNKVPSLSSGKIELSREFMKVFTREEVVETIKHEMAHALVPPTVRSHGPEWKHMARKLGSTGMRCLTAEESAKIQARYSGECPQGHPFKRHKKTSTMEVGGYYCPPCYKKKLEAAIVWKDTSTGKIVNPHSVKKSVPPPTPVVVKAAARTTPKLPKVVKAPAPTSWKDRYDRGDTSFADIW